MEDINNDLFMAMSRFRMLKHKQKRFLGLAPSEMMLLITIEEHVKEQKRQGIPAEGMKISDISEQMDCSISASSKLVKSMEEKGCIVRRENPADRRIVYLKLTEKGKTLLCRANEMRENTMKHVLAKIGEEDMRTFIRILESIYEIVQEEMEDSQKSC